MTLTVTLREIEPPLPEQVRVYVAVASGVIDSLPEIALVPLHPPEAEQLVEFVDDQIRVVAWPGLTVVILAEMATVGAEGEGGGGGGGGGVVFGGVVSAMYVSMLHPARPLVYETFHQV